VRSFWLALGVGLAEAGERELVPALRGPGDGAPGERGVGGRFAPQVDRLAQGGCGSYSIPSWIACAMSSPATRAASVNAMSMPDDTPAAVMILPCSTTRSEPGVAPNWLRSSSTRQCVVAFFPSSR